MPSHSESRVLPYTAKQLFDLVLDVERYPEFLPWCAGARINTRSARDLEADVLIGYKMFRENFSSRVHFTPSHDIEVEYLKGPMRHLHNTWIFTDVRGGCKVDFAVDFTLRSRLLEGLVEQFFDKALSKMISAFEARAAEIYPASA